MWSNKYIGIPYKEKGRDFSNVDCWGLVRLIYEQEYNITLPSFSSEYIQQDTDRIQDLISQYKEGWEPISTPKEGCVVLFRILGTESHVGIAISETHFIHAREGQSSTIESFDSVYWNKRIAGYFQYNENSNLMTAIPHPLRTERFIVPVMPGAKVSELVEYMHKQHNIQPELKSTAIVMINGRVIEEQQWPVFCINAGDTIEYRAVPRGGGGGFRMFAFIALAIAAPYIANIALGGTAGVSALAAAGTTGLASASALTLAATTVAASMVGSMLVNAIAPIRPPAEPNSNDPGSSERQLMVTGSANRANPYGSIPVVLGKVKLTPPLGANSFITYQNDRDTYLTMLLAWGYGPLSIDTNTLKIGDVLLSEYVLAKFTDNTNKLITLDRITEPSTSTLALFDSIYGNDVTQVSKNLVLVCDGNPETANLTPGPWTEVAVTETTNRIDVALHFSQGLRKIRVKGDGAGDSSTTSVQVRFEVKIGNATTWTLWKTMTYGADAVKKDAFTVTESFDVSNQIAQVRVRRETGDNTEDNPDWRYSHEVMLLSVTFTKNSKPTRDPKNCKIAKTAIQIQANDQLNNQIEGINAIVQTYCKTWNGTAWVDGTTNNPADLFRYVLQHPANPQRVLDSEVDTKINLSEIQRWRTYCATKGFTYNSVMGTQRSVLDTLRDICAAGRASPAFVDGKWSIVIDEPKTTIVQHFTPHNSWGFESTKALPKLPDALKINFYDEDQDYQEAESIVYNIGKNIDNAELFESISLPGVTKASLVKDHAKWHMAQAILRKEVYTINTDIEYIVCNRGDRVKVTHDVPMWGLGSGRIKNRISSTLFELDDPVAMEQLKQYTIRFRSNSGDSNSFTIKKSFTPVSISRTNNVVTLNFSDGDHPIQVGNTVGISTTYTALNSASATITEVGVNGSNGYIKYTLAGANIANTSVSGTISLGNGYYSIIELTQATTTNQADNENLFLFGEYLQEAQDLIITNIEPITNKSARLTLVDYGVTSTYNIFNDYQSLTEATVFETKITLPSKGLINGLTATDVPNITYIQSDDLVADIISPGTYAYKIKISYSNSPNLPNTVSTVECQYDYTSAANSRGYKSINVDFLSNTIEIPNVIAGEVYKIRLRYVSSDGRVGTWTNWITHTVTGKLANYNQVTSLTVKRSKKFLVITPFVTLLPDDFKYFETRVFKDNGSGDFWTDTNTAIKKYTSTGPVNVDLKDFSSPRLSASGIQYRIACRMVDATGNYSTVSALTSILLYNIAP